MIKSRDLPLGFIFLRNGTEDSKGKNEPRGGAVSSSDGDFIRGFGWPIVTSIY